MPFFETPQLTTYYEVHGRGWPLLLLISGLGGGSWSWYGQIPAFSRHYRTLVFDNQGAGRSSAPPEHYSMKKFAADALSLLDHLEVEEAFVMGLSMGGMIAQELALLAPRRVRALVLGCTHCGGRVRIPPSPEALRTLLDTTGLTHAQKIEKNLPLFLSEACRTHQPEAVAAYTSAQLSAPPQTEAAFQAQLAAIAHFDSCGRLSHIRMPTLIVTGTEDLLIPRGNAHYLARHIPNAQLCEIPGAGHAIHAECRDLLNGMVLRFLQHHSGNAA